MLQLFKSKENIRRNTYKIQISPKMNSRNSSRRSNDDDEDNDSRTIMNLIAPAAASALRSNWAHRQSRGVGWRDYER